MSSSRRCRLPVGVVVTVLAGAIAGCGDAGSETVTVTDPGPAETTSTTAAGDDAAEIQTVYGAYFDLLRAGEGEGACALLTEAYQEQTVQEAGGGDCPAAVLAFAGFFADYHPTLEDIEVSGETATATDPGDKEQSFDPQVVKFELVDDQWLIADAG